MNNDVCRLCSTNENLKYMFDEHRQKNMEVMRYIIWLGTGVEIKQNDIVSKMVCQRCCEIAVKLHKYRTNAVANDKLLKEQNGLPYTPPITDQDELFRVASNIVNEQKDISNISITNNSRLHCDPLDMLNLSFKKAIGNVKDNKSTPDLNKASKNSAVSPNKCKITPKVEYKHPSIQELFKTYKNIVLPAEVIKSDISPVISLDSAEISDWYAEQLNSLKSKLKGITFKEVPRSSNQISPLPTVPSKVTVTTPSKHTTTSMHSELTSSKRIIITKPKYRAATPKPSVAVSSEHSPAISPPKKQIVERSYSKILDTSDNDTDDIDREEFQQFHSDYEQENDILQKNLVTKEPSANQPTVVVNNNENSQIAKNQQVVTSSTSIKPHKQQSARKRTGRRSATKRKRVFSKEDDKTERAKKNKGDSSNSKISIPNDITVTRECLLENTEHKVVNTPPLELACNESLPELIKGKTLEIFMCPICNKLYDTKKELADHEKSHLKCKFCKKKVRNLALLEKHQNESCFINIVKNKPFIRLRKVDSIPSVLKQYADAFQQLNEEEESNYCENTDYTDESRPGIEEIVLPMPSENSFIESEETVTNTNSITANYEQNSEVVCISISDDSADEIECSEVPRHKIVNNPFASKTVESPSNESQSGTVDLTSDNSIPTISVKTKSTPTAPAPSILREKEMIRFLFKKHSYPVEKCENESQTFLASNHCIKYTNTNLIVLDSMFPELSAYKIPVHLESQQKISARFKGNVSIPEQPGSLECWAFKIPIAIEKQVTAYANRASSDTLSNNTVTLNLINTPSSTPRLLGAFPTFSESLVVKTPTVLEGLLSSNVTMPVAKTTFSTANSVPFTLSSAAATNFYNGTSTPTILALDSTAPISNTKQLTKFVQVIEPSNTIQYQAPVVPHSSASLVSNQVHDKNQRLENVLHINNNVTNINKFFVLANNVQQIPTRISTLNSRTSYVNNVYPNLTLSNEQSVEIREVETVDENSSVVLYNANNDQTTNNRLRVKNISELN